MKNILVTGGAGFIGSAFVRYMIGGYPAYNIVVLDKLTYAGNLDNLLPVKDDPRYRFERADIADRAAVERIVDQYQIDTIINFAAETHVDRSILEPDAFIHTDVLGTYVLLEMMRTRNVGRMLHVSTDEVYGDVQTGYSVETDAFAPNSPYAASKASAELMIRAFHQTYGLDVVVTRGSNTFGPYQYPEKLMPLFISEAIDDQPLPLYGDGMQVRDWLYVMDHVTGIDTALHRGLAGEAYNVAGENEQCNIDVVRMLLRGLGKPESLIRHVQDRPGHDRRYAMNCAKLRALGWQRQRTFEEALRETVAWYAENDWWWRKIKTGEYLAYYKAQYAARLAGG
jgi:dTDP-glucose 4,6-dehydratase